MEPVGAVNGGNFEDSCSNPSNMGLRQHSRTLPSAVSFCSTESIFSSPRCTNDIGAEVVTLDPDGIAAEQQQQQLVEDSCSSESSSEADLEETLGHQEELLDEECFELPIDAGPAAQHDDMPSSCISSIPTSEATFIERDADEGVHEDAAQLQEAGMGPLSPSLSRQPTELMRRPSRFNPYSLLQQRYGDVEQHNTELRLLLQHAERTVQAAISSLALSNSSGRSNGSSTHETLLLLSQLHDDLVLGLRAPGPLPCHALPQAGKVQADEPEQPRVPLAVMRKMAAGPADLQSASSAPPTTRYPPGEQPSASHIHEQSAAAPAAGMQGFGPAQQRQLPPCSPAVQVMPSYAHGTAAAFAGDAQVFVRVAPRAEATPSMYATERSTLGASGLPVDYLRRTSSDGAAVRPVVDSASCASKGTPRRMIDLARHAGISTPSRHGISSQLAATPGKPVAQVSLLPPGTPEGRAPPASPACHGSTQQGGASASDYSLRAALLQARWERVQETQQRPGSGAEGDAAIGVAAQGKQQQQVQRRRTAHEVGSGWHPATLFPPDAAIEPVPVDDSVCSLRRGALQCCPAWPEHWNRKMGAMGGDGSDPSSGLQRGDGVAAAAQKQGSDADADAGFAPQYSSVSPTVVPPAAARPTLVRQQVASHMTDSGRNFSLHLAATASAAAAAAVAAKSGRS